MVALQVRNVSAETQLALTGEAERRGQSLQAYLADVLDREVGVITNRRLLHAWAAAPLMDGPSGESVAEALGVGREEREQQLASLAQQD